MIQRPQTGEEYFAPVSLSSTEPLVFGERRGVLVDTPSQTAAVVYSTRDAAEGALGDPAVWHPTNAAALRVARVRYLGAARLLTRFEFADEDERAAHLAAIDREVATG